MYGDLITVVLRHARSVVGKRMSPNSGPPVITSTSTPIAVSSRIHAMCRVSPPPRIMPRHRSSMVTFMTGSRALRLPHPGVAVHVPARPELEAHERPDAFGVIARSVFMLPQERAHFVRVRPPALGRVRVDQDLARPADHLLVEPP